MKERKPIETEAQLLYSLERLFVNISESDSIEDIDNELAEYGYDPNILGGKINTLAKSALKESPLNWRNQARQKLEAARERFAEFDRTESDQNLDRSMLSDKIQKLLGSLGYKNSQLIPAHFRNYDKASDRDLLNILKELEFLALDEDNHEE